MKFSIKDFSGKCDQIRKKLQIWSHLLDKSLIENFIFCAVYTAIIFVATSHHCSHKNLLINFKNSSEYITGGIRFNKFVSWKVDSITYA